MTHFIPTKDLPPRLQKEYQEQTQQTNYIKIGLKYCKICGYYQWITSTPTGQAGIELHPYAINQIGTTCPRCKEISERNPETYQWIINTLILHDILPTEENQWPKNIK